MKRSSHVIEKLVKLVGTRSTKSSHKKTSSNKAAASAKPGTVTPEKNVPEVSERNWRIAAIAIFLIGAVLRLYHLSLVPFHHDEGVNGNFLVRLVREHIYRYDPANYHGPTLYYFA